MKSFFAYINLDGVPTLLEFNYEHRGNGTFQVIEFFDQHGDTPDITDLQEQLIINDIRQFEKEDCQGFDQNKLSLHFRTLR